MTIRFRPLAALAALLAALAAPAAIADPQPQPTGQTAPAAAPDAQPDQGMIAVPGVDSAHPALWKVADADTTIYLFGTIHALPAGIDWFGGRIVEAFDGSQELVTEIPAQDPVGNKEAFLARASLPAGENLRELLSPELRTAYEAALPGLGLPQGAFDRFEPWYAAVLLSVLPVMSEGLARENGVETALDWKATQLKLTRGALETADYQLGLFDSLPLDVQESYLAEVVKALPTIRSDLKAMIAAWQHGDAETLARLINAQEDDPRLVEVLLTNRNKAWAGWIARRLQEPGTVFLAVGAGHLAGAGSVQDQLSAQGIASERVQ